MSSIKSGRNITEWIFPSKSSSYDIELAYKKHTHIHWRQNVGLSEGDIVFLYRVSPHKKIVYQMVVTQINIPYSASFADKACWSKPMHIENLNYKKPFFRMEFIRYLDSDRLSYHNLLQHDLNGPIQGPLKVLPNKPELSAYIHNVFTHAYPSEPSCFFPDEIKASDRAAYYEGTQKQITVNAYERNPKAREKCIKYHGTKCAICGFSFGDFYGSEFADIIHVHHRVPLSKISGTYKVDPQKDLIPVCPNCHVILHSHAGSVYSIEEVKAMLSKKR